MIIKHDEAAGLIVHWPKADFIRYPPTSGPAAFLTSSVLKLGLKGEKNLLLFKT